MVVDRSLLVCANARSGSFMLCRALADAGRAGVPDEYLLAANPADFPTWGFWEDGLFGSEWNSRDRSHYLDQVYAAGSTTNGVFGLKLMWNQVPWILGLFRELSIYADKSDAEIFRAAFPGLHCVLLTRRDRLRQAVSWARASQEGVWEVREDLPANPTGSTTYDADLIESMEQVIADGENSWRVFFDQLEITPLEVVYEDMVRDLSGTVASVLDHLGISPVGLDALAPRTIRQADLVNDEWVERFRSEHR